MFATNMRIVVCGLELVSADGAGEGDRWATPRYIELMAELLTIMTVGQMTKQ